MTPRTDIQPLPFVDRFQMALEGLKVRAEERDGFLSDDDVLDIAQVWSTSDLEKAYGGDCDPDPSEVADYEALRDALFAHLES